MMDRKSWLEMRSNKMVGAAGLLKNEDGLYLLVKPGYKDSWLFPGGGVDPYEHPKEACRREFLEEVNLKVNIGKLLQVSSKFLIEEVGRYDFFNFLFEVECEDLSVLKVDGEEIVDYKWVSLEEAEKMMSKSWGKRLRGLGGDIYFELT